MIKKILLTNIFIFLILISFTYADSRDDIWDNAIHIWELVNESMNHTDLKGNSDIVSNGNLQWFNNDSCLNGMDGCMFFNGGASGGAPDNYMSYYYDNTKFPNDFCVMIWAKPQFTSGEYYKMLITAGRTATTNWNFRANSESGRNLFASRKFDTNNLDQYTSESVFYGWNLHTLNYNSSSVQFSIYINSTKLSVSADTASGGSTDSALTTYIGEGQNGVGNWVGLIGNIVMLNKSCSDEIISYYYNNGIAVTYYEEINDTTPPNITILSPINNSNVTTNIFINFTTDESSVCTINNTLWNNIIDNGTYFSYYETEVENLQDYSIEISCMDGVFNEQIEILTFYKNNPEIIIFKPNNNSVLKSTEINITFQNYNFNSTNCTIYSNITGNYVQYDSNEILTGFLNNYSYNFNITPTINISSIISFYIECNNPYNINSSLYLINFSNDFYPPIINLFFINQTYNETYNIDVWINFSTSEYSVCSINATNWTLNSENGTYFTYKDNNNLNNFFAFTINCTDLFGNIRYKDLFFTKDLEYPLIDYLLPTETNITLYSGSNIIEIIINTTDNIDLYYLDFNITEIIEHDFLPDTEILLFNKTLNISGTNYLFYEQINISQWNDGEKIGKCRICDSHTKNEIINLYNDKNLKTNELIYSYDNKNIIIKSLKGNVSNIETKKYYDRYSFNFEYKDNELIKEYEIIADKIVYRKSSPYKAHFVVNDFFWIDFENENDVTVRLENSSYIISVYNGNNKVSFNSIGFLNCITSDVTFETFRVQTLPDINPLNFTNTILFYSLFVFIQLFFLYLSLKFDIKWVGILSSIMGIMISLSFLRFVTLNVLFQNSILIYIFVNILIMFLLANKE